MADLGRTSSLRKKLVNSIIREMAVLERWAKANWDILAGPLGFTRKHPPCDTTFSRTLADFSLGEFRQGRFRHRQLTAVDQALDKGEAVRITLYGLEGSTNLTLGGEVRWHRQAPDGTHAIGAKFTGTAAVLAGRMLGTVIECHAHQHIHGHGSQALQHDGTARQRPSIGAKGRVVYPNA